MILVAADLTPSDTAQLDQRKSWASAPVGGATAQRHSGPRPGHSAVVGLGSQVWQLASGQTVGLDGSRGQVWPQPDDGQLAVLQSAPGGLAKRRKQTAEPPAGARPSLRMGGRLKVAANIGGRVMCRWPWTTGPKGVGLFRTEFLFMRPAPPDEAEQLAAHREVAAAMAPRPVIIRTLDVGGDKPLPYLTWAARRILSWATASACTGRIFQTTAAGYPAGQPGHNLRVMAFPMIGTLAELRAARAMLAPKRRPSCGPKMCL